MYDVYRNLYRHNSQQYCCSVYYNTKLCLQFSALKTKENLKCKTTTFTTNVSSSKNRLVTFLDDNCRNTQLFGQEKKKFQLQLLSYNFTDSIGILIDIVPPLTSDDEIGTRAFVVGTANVTPLLKRVYKT